MGPGARTSLDERILAVVDRDVDDARYVRLERLLQRRGQGRCALDGKPSNAERFRQRGKIRVSEFRAERAPEAGHLFPSDAPEAAIPEDQVDSRDPLSLCRLELVRGHQEAAVSTDRDDTPTGVQELRRDATGDGDAHGGEAVRDEDRVGLR